ncbi:MAG: PA14 domain-containing protein, partial [Verrucomicrobiota bacterium]
DPLSIPAYATYTGPARPYVKFSVSPTPWDNRIMQSGPGLIKAYGRTVNSAGGGDIVNDSDTRRPWADVGIGGVIANGVGNTLGLLLNGNPVTPTFTTNGTDVTVVYRPNPALPSGSTNTASLVYGGTTNSWTFIVQTYTNLNSSDALPLSAADPSARGFRVKMTQVASIPAGVTQNSVARAESQIGGTLGTDISVPGTSDNGTYIYPNIINWNNNRNPNRSGVELGNFQDNVYGSGWPYPDYADEPLPGLPGTGSGIANNYTDNAAAEIFAYLAFPNAGYYRFGVNSDDGFAMKVGTPGQTNGPVVFATDVGKGSSDIPFSVSVPQAGLYPIRLVYYNGGGGANIEYFSYDDNGNKIPVNDTNNPAAIKAYYNANGGPVGPEIKTASVSGGQITITWTGGGTLESSPTLGTGAVWTSTGNSSGSFTEAVNGKAKFYRVKQ